MQFKALYHLFGISLDMLQPGVRVGGKVGVVTENVGQQVIFPPAEPQLKSGMPVTEEDKGRGRQGEDRKPLKNSPCPGILTTAASELAGDQCFQLGWFYSNCISG